MKQLPEISLKHVYTLTDDFAIYQFARGIEPDPAFDYCVDDVCRALIVACMHWQYAPHERDEALISRYLDFIDFAQDSKTGWFYNYVSLDRTVNTSDISADAHARTLWSLGYVIHTSTLPISIHERAKELFLHGLQSYHVFRTVRSHAYAVLALYFLYSSGQSEILPYLINSADFLVTAYNRSSSSEWRWFERTLTYANSKLCEALYYAFLVTKRPEYLSIARISLDFLLGQSYINGVYHPIGQDGWYIQNEQRALFDQQPIDVGTMVQTLRVVFLTTQEKRYEDLSYDVYSWFLGNNSGNCVMYNTETGGCYDGLMKDGFNANQGAESTLKHLIARLSLEDSVRLI